MRKILAILVAVLFAGFLSMAPAKAAGETDDEIINNLRSKCYESAKAQYDEKTKNISSSAVQSFDPAQFPEFSQMFGGEEASQMIGSFQDLFKGLIPGMSTDLKDNLTAVAQVNADLASCYERETSGNPALNQKAKELVSKAQSDLEAVKSYNYDQLFETGKKPTSMITIPAKSRKVFRLRTFCLDGDLETPNAGAKYLLAGSAEIAKKGLSSVLKSAQNGDINKIQESIWKNKVEPKEVNEASSKSEKKPVKNLALPIAIACGVVFLGLLILGIVKIKTFSFSGKVVWVLATVITVGVGGFSAYKLVYKESVKLPGIFVKSDDITVASNRGLLTVAAVSPGTFSDLDIEVSNNTKKDVSVNSSEIFFVPDGGDGGSCEEEPQRLGSSGTTGDGPPYPPAPPDPNEFLKDRSKKTEDDFKKSLEDLKKEPTLDKAKDSLGKLTKCQAVGCPSSDTGLGEIGDAFQGKIDKDLEDFLKDPSDENKCKLMRAIQRGQAVGAKTSAAEKALGISN